MAKYIDKKPPALTGDAKKDLQAMYDYIFYMQERLNFIISTMNKNGG